MTALKVMGPRAIVQADPSVGVTDMGLILPDTAQVRAQRGTILAVGDIDQVNPGDVVLWREYGDSLIKVNGQRFVIVDEDSLLAIVEDG